VELTKVVINEVLLKLSDEHLSVRLTYELFAGSVQNIERNGLNRLAEVRQKETFSKVQH